MSETWAEHMSRKFSEKLDEYKERWTIRGYIQGIKKYIEKITKEVTEGKPMTDIYRMLNNSKTGLLSKLKVLFESEEFYLGPNLMHSYRTVWHLLGGNYGRSSGAISDDLQNIIKNIKNGDYTTYKPCMRNMLKLLKLDTTDRDWLTRLYIMSTKEFVTTDYFVFGTDSRWDESVREAAKNLKNALKKIKPKSLVTDKDYKLFFNGSISELFIHDTDKDVNDNFKEIVGFGVIDNPIHKTMTEKELYNFIKEFISEDGNKESILIRKYKTNEKYYAVIPKGGIWNLVKFKSDKKYNAYKNESVTYEKVMETADD